MSFVNAAILKSFKDAEWLTGDDPPEGLSEAILQADDIIYQKTGIKPPSDPMTARAILRNYACALIVWFMSGTQEKIDEQELKRREKQYDDAIAGLEDIQSGKTKIIDDNGKVVSEPPRILASFHSTKRITGAL